MGAALLFLLLMAVLYWMATRPAPMAPIAQAPTPEVSAPPRAEPPTPAPKQSREELRAALQERLENATPAVADDPLPAVELSVSVVDDAGEPLRRVPVNIRHSARGRPQRFFTDARGKLQQRVDAGVLVLVAERADGLLVSRSDPVEIDGREGGSWTVELVIASEQKAGLGVNIAPAPEGIRILAVHAGTPAEAAGLQPRDVVTAVEGNPTKGMPLVDFVEQMTGPVGTKVLFDVLRADGTEERMQVERQLLEKHQRDASEDD